MRIIDAHLHFSDLDTFKKTALELSHVKYSAAGLSAEFEAAGIITGIGMGITETGPGSFPDNSAPNPMGLDLEKQLPDFIFHCSGVNPYKIRSDDKKGLASLEAELQKPKTVGIKIYAGYYHYHIYDEIYEPVYELAAKYGLPVVIHTGDTYSERGLLKYSHPLNVDELAVKHREIDFVIAHFGDPWIMDTAEIIRKNPNAYADLSGLIVGDDKEIARYSSKLRAIEHFKKGLMYADSYGKILFGSDWPLVPIKPYVEFVKSLVPEEHQNRVFYLNALNVFSKMQSFI